MLPTARFGRTGHDSTRVIFGAAGLGGVSQGTADRILAEVEAAGINHIDTVVGTASPRFGCSRGSPTTATRFLPPRPATGRATGSGCPSSARLERMGVDHVDLVQLHNLVEEDEWEVAHDAGGAVEALALLATRV